MDLIKRFTANRQAKDSVFTRLFSEQDYLFALYQALYPDDKETTIDELEDITIRNSLVISIYNDLAFLVGDRLIALVEAQSTWSNNIVLREFLYLAPTIERYLSRRNLSVARKKAIDLPRIELYVLYTGNQGERPDALTMTEQHFRGDPNDLELTVHVLRNGRDGDIIYQYVGFTRVFDEQMRLYQDDKQLAVEETIRICRDRGLLAKFMEEREGEVMSILGTQFEVELAIKNWREEEREEGYEEGHEDGYEEGHEEGHEEGYEEGHKDGREEGIEIGTERKTIQFVRNLLVRGYDVAEIAALADTTVEKVNEIASSLG